MIERLAADAVMLLHFAFVLFVVFGAALVMRHAWIAALHLPAVAWAAFIELSGGVCPLTIVEVELRHRARLAGPEGGFIEHYIYPILYPPGLTRSMQLILAGLVLAGNAALYAGILHAARQRSRSERRAGR